jgi:hypothetical protein
MTDPITSLTPASPLAATRAPATPTPSTPAATPTVAPADPDPNAVSPAPPTPAPAAQSPVALSVDRDPSGVFVYTLTDRGTGQVLAVIPRALTQGVAGRPGGEVDLQA